MQTLIRETVLDVIIAEFVGYKCHLHALGNLFLVNQNSTARLRGKGFSKEKRIQ